MSSISTWENNLNNWSVMPDEIVKKKKEQDINARKDKATT